MHLVYVNRKAYKLLMRAKNDNEENSAGFWGDKPTV
jgi:hypothetical protein